MTDDFRFHFGERRIVIADVDGVPAVISSGPPSRVVEIPSIPGTRYVHVWSTDGIPVLPHDWSDPALDLHPFNVPPGGTRFSLARLPSKAELDSAVGGEYVEDPNWLLADYRANYGVIEPKDAISYAVVLDGTPAIRVGDKVVQLRRGDVVVNTATDYHWDNPGEVAAWVAFVRVGAQRATE